MGEPRFGFKDYDDMFVKRAVSGGCGSEERAREAARAREITGINSQNDVNQMIDWCKQEDNKKSKDLLANMPAGPSGPANTLSNSPGQNEDFLGGTGLTPAEFEKQRVEDLRFIDAEIEQNRLKTAGNIQTGLEQLKNDASKYVVDGAIAQEQIEQDGLNFRTRYTSDTSLDLQRIRNAGAREVALISRDATIFGGLVNSFNF